MAGSESWFKLSERTGRISRRRNRRKKPVPSFLGGTGFSFALGQMILERSRVQRSVNLRHQSSATFNIPILHASSCCVGGIGSNYQFAIGVSLNSRTSLG